MPSQDEPITRQQAEEDASALDDDARESLAATCSPHEWAFANEYVIDFNGRQSVIRTGMFKCADVNRANEAACRLLARVHVQAAIMLLKAQREARVHMKQDSVISELALLSHSNIAHYTVDDDGNVKLTPGAPEGAMRAIKSVKRKKIVKEHKDGSLTITYDVELTLWDKPAPLKLMGRHMGLFPDRVELTGKDGAPLEMTNLSQDELKQRARELAKLAETLPTTNAE